MAKTPSQSTYEEKGFIFGSHFQRRPWLIRLIALLCGDEAEQTCLPLMTWKRGEGGWEVGEEGGGGGK